MSIKTYSELKELKTFKERFDYLKSDSKVGESTFGFNRFLNQSFYASAKWKEIRRQVIIRDNCCDLGIDGEDIYGNRVEIHHLNPLTEEDIVNQTEYLLDPEYLITTSHDTHNALRYGDDSYLDKFKNVERTEGDTTVWKTDEASDTSEDVEDISEEPDEEEYHS